MRVLALGCLMASAVLAAADDDAAGKRHVYRAAELHKMFAPPRGAKADWRPVVRVKANDQITIVYPFAKADLDAFRCSCDNGDVQLTLSDDERGVLVVIDTGGRGKGKKASAKVTWSVVEVNGREHRWSTDVVFE
jgi:hypothetical protein